MLLELFARTDTCGTRGSIIAGELDKWKLDCGVELEAKLETNKTMCLKINHDVTVYGGVEIDAAGGYIIDADKPSVPRTVPANTSFVIGKNHWVEFEDEIPADAPFVLNRKTYIFNAYVRERYLKVKKRV